MDLYIKFKNKAFTSGGEYEWFFGNQTIDPYALPEKMNEVQKIFDKG